MLWALVTATVGYGDVSPHTETGRAIAPWFDAAFLISNDSDLAIPVRTVREHGYPVWVMNPRGPRHPELTPNGSFHRQPRRSHLVSSQLPNPVETTSGQIYRPRGPSLTGWPSSFLGGATAPTKQCGELRPIYHIRPSDPLPQPGDRTFALGFASHVRPRRAKCGDE
jgi:hypothetical protein